MRAGWMAETRCRRVVHCKGRKIRAEASLWRAVCVRGLCARNDCWALLFHLSPLANGWFLLFTSSGIPLCSDNLLKFIIIMYIKYLGYYLYMSKSTNNYRTVSSPLFCSSSPCIVFPKQFECCSLTILYIFRIYFRIF